MPTFGRELMERAKFLQQKIAPFKPWSLEALISVARRMHASTTVRGHPIFRASQQRVRQVIFVVQGIVQIHTSEDWQQSDCLDEQFTLAGPGSFYGAHSVVLRSFNGLISY